MRMGFPGRQTAAVALVAAVALAACGDDDDLAGTTSTLETTTSSMVTDDEGIAATLDDLCAELVDLRNVAQGIDTSDDEGMVEMITTSLQRIEARLDDLGGEDRTDQFEGVVDAVRNAMDTLEAAAEAAVEGNFGNASDLFQQAMDELDRAMADASDLGISACEAPPPTTTSTTAAGG